MQSAIRIALDKDKSKKALDYRIRQIAKTLRELRRGIDKERGGGTSDTIRVTEFGSEYGN